MSEPTSLAAAPPTLWRNRSFVRLWFAQIVSNAGSQITGVALPLIAVLLLGYLTFAQLYLVAFGVGTLTVFFSLASISLLPSLVKGEQLVEANSKLAIGDSVLSIAGPSGAGALVQLVGAPRAIVADAISFVLSAFALRGVDVPEQPRRAQRRSLWSEIGG